MSSSSLIFSIGAISMKVNLVFVFILIIASSLAIHLSTYIQPSHWLWGILKLDFYHGPHTFSWGVSACHHKMVWSWTHIMVLTPSVWGVSACRHETVWTWTHIMVLTPSLEVSLPIVMRRSDLGLISWSSHLLLRCLSLSSWDGLNLGLYGGPHTFCLRCLRLSSWDGLIFDSYHSPHTFFPRFLYLSSYDCLNLGSYCGPHTFCLRCPRSS